MLLLECHIDNFGRLSDERIVFSEGLNTVYRENGWGKSTLLAFIKAMLFGLDDTRRQSLDENERKKYLPWQGGGFGGSLSFADGKKKYRIERSFSQKPSEDTFTLYDLSTGLVSADYSSAVGEELFGIDADGFERTVFLSERSLSEKNDKKSISTISAKLSNLVGVSGDVSELDDAFKLLDERRKFYYKKGGGGEIGRLDGEISQLNLHLSELMRLKESVAETELQIKDAERRLASLKAERGTIVALREKAGMLSQYSIMKEQLNERESRLCEFNLIFGDYPTSEAEIEIILQKRAEAERLSATVGDADSKVLPDESEIDEHIAALDRARGASRGKSRLLLLAAILALALGGALAALVSIPLIGVGIVLSLPFFLLSIRAARSFRAALRVKESAREFIFSYMGESTPDGSLTSRLFALKESAKACRGELERNRKDAERRAALLLEVEAFLSRYPKIRGDEALAQLLRFAREREYLVADIERMRASLQSFKTSNAIDDTARVTPIGSAEGVEREISETERRIALLKKQYEYDCSLLETEDELRAKLCELEDTRELYRENLNAIQKTVKFLEKARDNLNSRYLGGTQASFEKYVNMISGEGGDYSIDTSFRVSKNERGSAKLSEAYSRGTRELYALAIRLALIDSLYENESPFIMLDDPFASFDDRKVEAALSILKKIAVRKQIIYMTCSSQRKP